MQTGSIRLWQRVLAVLCAVAMLLATFPQGAYTAFAEEVSAAETTQEQSIPSEPSVTPAPAVPAEPSNAAVDPASATEVKITAIAFPDKTYDGTTDIDETKAVYTLDPAVEGATISDLTFTLDNKDVGTRNVTVSGTPTISGVTGNYNVTLNLSSTPTVEVTKKPVTITNITFANAKTYDGSTTVDPTAAAYTLDPEVPGAVITGLTFAQDNKNVGTRNVTVSGTAEIKDEEGNYEITVAASVKPTIEVTKKAVTVTQISFSPKTYDGTKNVDETTAVYEFDTAMPTDVKITGLTFTMENPDVGKQKVNVDGTPKIEKEEGNYTVTLAPGLAPEIQVAQKVIAVKKITFDGTIYDGTTDIDATTAHYTLEPAISGAMIGGLTFTRETPNAGTQKVLVDSTNLTISGVTGNYTVALDPNLAPTIEVAKKPVTITKITFPEKTYDGTTDIDATTAVYRLDPEVPSAAVTGLTFTQKEKNAGVQDVAVSGTAKINDNYEITIGAAVLPTIQVVKKAVTVKKISFPGKEYDATTDVDAATAVYEFDTQMPTDAKIIGLTFTMEGPDVGKQKVNFDKDKTLPLEIENEEGNYTVTLDTALAPEIEVKAKEISVAVKEGVTFTKTSDGRATVPESMADPANYGLNDVCEADTAKVTLASVTTDNWGYQNSEMGKDISIGNVEIGNFTLGGDKAGNYKIVALPSLEGNITAVPVENIDLTSGTDTFALSDTAEIAFAPRTKGEAGDYWYNSKNNTISLAPGETAKFVNENKEPYEMNLTEGTNQEFADGYVKKDNIFYGPLKITYSYDNQTPAVTLESAEVTNGSQAGTMDMDNTEITYTFTVTDEANGSGVRTETVQYLITNNSENKPAITDGGWVNATVNNMTFKVTAVQSGYIWVKAGDNAGNEAASDYRAMVIERTAPTGTVVIDDNTDKKDAYEQSHKVMITVEDGAESATEPYPYSGIKKVTCTLMQNGAVVFTQEEENTAPETFQDVNRFREMEMNLDNISQDSNGNALDGDYTLTVTASDFCGNTADIVKDVPLHFDNAAPEVTLSMEGGNESDGTFYYRAETSTVRVKFTDARLGDEGGKYSVTVTKDDGKNKTKQLETTALETEGEVSFTSSDLFGDGKYTIMVEAADHAGNVAAGLVCAEGKDQNNGQFVLDTTPPKIQMVMANASEKNCDNDDVYYYNSGNAKGTITFTDDNLAVQGEPASYTATINGVEKTHESGTISFVHDDLGDDGLKVITAKAVDIAGNETTAFNALNDATAPSAGISLNSDGKQASFILDTKAPEVTVTMKNGNLLDNIAWYRADNAGISVEFKDNYLDVDTLKSSYSVTIDGMEAEKIPERKGSSGKVEFTAEEVVASGDGAEKAITVTAVDAAGNRTAELVRNGLSSKIKDATGYFALDTKAPVLESVSSTEGNYVDACKKKYWNAEFTVTYTVTEDFFQYIAEKPVYVDANVVLEEGSAAGVTVVPNTGDTAITITVTPDEGAEIVNNVYSTYLTLKDAAGNQMVLNGGNAYTAPDDVNYTPASGDSCAKAETVTRFVLDTFAPIATLDMSGGYLNGYKGDTADYYNEDITATFTVKEENYPVPAETDQYVTAQMGEKKIPAQEDNSKVFTETIPAEIGNEGRYTFTLQGKDLAGNEMTFAAGKNISEEDAKAIKTAVETFTTTEKVLDVTNPVVSAAFETDAANKDKRNNDRFYYNKSFKASFKVEDTNFTEEKVKALYGHSDPDNYETGSVEVGNTEMSRNDSVYERDNSDNGLYVFSIEGYDKAGNPLVDNSTDAETADKVIPRTEKAEDEKNTRSGTITTYVAVIDTVAPEMAVTVNDYYEANLNADGSYSVEKNAPYRKETQATLTMKGDDKSPVDLQYELISSINNGKAKTEEGAYTYKAEDSHTFNGEQVFAIKTLKVTDLAGNVSEAPQAIDGNVSNYIYLDVTPPVEDRLAPTVALVAHESGVGRSTEGVDLYDGTVTVEAQISDPGFKDEPHDAGGTSSGLYRLYYEVLQKENGDWTSWMDGKIATLAGGEITPAEGIVQYAEGPEYNGIQNEKLKGEDTVTFTFDAETFNYNDITLRVWVEDNTGNRSGGTFYTFGIDTTAPTIEVSYDNNDAQNEKYFKADRTATVVVTERNFNPDATEILTEDTASVGSWSYAAGGAKNGDEDTWTCQVSYTQDGDYTFDVHAKDLAGHDAGEADYGSSVAPKEFVIDKTNPVIEISFDNNDVRNGKYYMEVRTATVRVEEHNFSADGATVTTTASIAEGNVSAPGAGSWSTSGDSSAAQVPFTSDGDYTMHVEYVDLAGNEAEPQDVDEFTVDTTAPELEIGGVEDRMAYNGDVAPSITYHDINYDNTSAGVSITGYKHPEGSNLTGSRTDDTFGGSFICDNIEVVKENDDVYTATGSVSDLAGNTTEETILFSVNRFGSTYVLSKETQALVDGYYTNTPQALHVTEINVSPLEKQEITTSLNGEVTTLRPETDYTVQSANPGWMQYDYTIQASNFEKEGAYTVTLYSEDAATNSNTNRAVKGDAGETNELPIDFLVDMTAPVTLITGVEDNERYVDTQRTLVVHYDDNTAVAGLMLYLNDQKTAEYDGEELAKMGGELQYVANASNDWQVLRVVSVDVAGNQTETKSGRFLLTDNLWVQYINNKPLLFGSIGLLALLFILILLFKCKKDKEEEQKKQKV